MIQYCSLILKWFPLFLSPMIFIICPGLLSFRSMLILINITTDTHYSTLSPVPKWRLFLYTLHTLRLVHLSQISVQTGKECFWKLQTSLRKNIWVWEQFGIWTGIAYLHEKVAIGAISPDSVVMDLSVQPLNWFVYQCLSIWCVL